jgi:hypothetical protein
LATHNPRKSLKLALSQPLRGLEWWPRGSASTGMEYSMAARAHKTPRGSSYLHWHGQSWRVQLAVPARLREAIGCAVLYHPLHTDSLAIAERTKHRAIASLKTGSTRLRSS